MFNLKHWLNLATNPQEYIWVEVLLIKETPKALLIEFDDKEIWLPKTRILSIKHHKARPHHREPRRGEAISIKISQYHWAKKSQ